MKIDHLHIHSPWPLPYFFFPFLFFSFFQRIVIDKFCPVGFRKGQAAGEVARAEVEAVQGDGQVADVEEEAEGARPLLRGKAAERGAEGGGEEGAEAASEGHEAGCEAPASDEEGR